MAIGVSSIIQAKLFQRQGSQQVLNVQHYFITAMETLADDLSDYAQPMFNHWCTNLKPVQNVSLTWERCELYEVNGLDFGIYTPFQPIPGEIGGEPLPAFVTVKVQQVRQTRTTRHGWKRFSGLSETDTAGDQLLAAKLTNWTGAIGNVLTPLLTLTSAEFPGTRNITLQPIIWGGNDPAYPQGRYSTIAGNVVSSTVTTQNTRKRGRGA